MPVPDTGPIGVFGGTFDPVHRGHLAAAAGVRDALGLASVLLVVANDPWKKWDREVTSAGDRLALVAAAVAGEEGLEVCDAELRRGGTSYTVDTLVDLKRVYPGRDLVLVVGADLVGEMATWERAGRLTELASVAVVTRPGSAIPGDVVRRWHAAVVALDTPEVSSTEIRRRLAAGEEVADLIPAAVLDVIVERGLYGARQGEP